MYSNVQIFLLLYKLLIKLLFVLIFLLMLPILCAIFVIMTQQLNFYDVTMCHYDVTICDYDVTICDYDVTIWFSSRLRGWRRLQHADPDHSWDHPGGPDRGRAGRLLHRQEALVQSERVLHHITMALESRKRFKLKTSRELTCSTTIVILLNFRCFFLFQLNFVAISFKTIMWFEIKFYD